MRSDAFNELASALAKAQGEMRPAVFDKINPHFKSPYASLASCWESVRAPLSKNGLSLTQIVEARDNTLFLVTTLMHTSGQWVDSEWPLSGGTVQQQGSSLSYLRRYSLSAILGIVSDEDDDGEHASHPPKPTMAKRKEPKAPHKGEPGDYVPEVTKEFSGKKLRDASLSKLSAMVNWYMTQLGEGKRFGDKHMEFLEHATKYLESSQMAQAPAKDKDMEIPF